MPSTSAARPLARIASFLLFAGVAGAPPFAGQDARSTAVESVRERLPGCEKCVFFAIPAASPLVQKHKLFFVSTLDRVPPPIWAVAVSTRGTALLLGGGDFKDWNVLVKAEGVSLKTDASALEFAKAFADLAAGRATYVDRLDAGAEKRLREKLGRNPSATLKIVRTSGRVRLQFFAKDAAGSLRWWDLIADPSGRLLEVNVREF